MKDGAAHLQAHAAVVLEGAGRQDPANKNDAVYMMHAKTS